MKKIPLAITLALGLHATAFAGCQDEFSTAFLTGDYTQALKECVPQAEQGDAYAQTNLGFMYRDGKGVRRDYQLAAAWFRRAAEQGELMAESELANMYKDGKGVPQDLVLAYMLYNLAAANGDKWAAEHRDRIAKEMRPEQVEEGQTLASSWKPGTPLPSKSKTGLKKIR